MKQKINLRLTLIALIAILATAIGITLVFYNIFQKRVMDDLQLNAQLLSDTELFQNLNRTSGEEIRELDNSALKKLEADNLRITWISADGTVLYDNDTNIIGLENHHDRPEIAAAKKNGFGSSVRKSDTMNYSNFYYALLLEDGTILRVSTQARAISSVLLASLPVILVIIAVILAICTILGHLLTAQLLKPIDLMAEQLESRIEIPVYKELEPFAVKIRSQHENILAAAEMRQDFTANVSHELKTPLTAISGYAELVENQMIPGEQIAYIGGQIRKNAERLLSLINDIIRLSELDHKELPRRFTNLDLYALAQECCRGLAVTAAQKNIRIELSGTSAWISGEYDLMKELLENLIQNAIRYNREGGWVRVLVSQQNNHTKLVIEDNGIGIRKEAQERVFERFYRVDKSRSRETGGTGLGLAIVKHIVEIHNAEISLESEPDRGTKITVRF